MSPTLLLGIVSALMAFLLKTTLAFGVCVALTWLVDSPNRKFVIWLSFLVGATGYWLWMLIGFWPAARAATALPATAAAATSQTTFSAVTGVHAWQIPDAWSFPLGIAVRVLAVLYVLTVAYLLASHLRKQRHLKWVLSFTSEPPQEITEIFRPLARELHAERSRLLVLSGVSSPATFGWFRPTILLPAECLEQDRPELEDILRHELHHIRRWDFAWNALAQICRSFLFFQPAASYALNRMQHNRELACDLAVVSASPERRAGYAECLIHFARLNTVNDPKNWGIDFAASTEQLKARVHSVLSGAKKTPLILLGLRAVCGVTLLAGFLNVAPSLALLLAFAPPPVSQPPGQELAATPRTKTKSAKTLRRAAQHSATDGVIPITAEPRDQANQPAADLPIETASVLPLPTGSGPKLVRRPATATALKPAATAQQTIALDDEGKSVGKKGDPNRADALQQTATAAAALYKRLESLKPER